MFVSQPNYTVILFIKDLLDQGASGHFFHLQVRDTVEPAGVQDLYRLRVQKMTITGKLD